MVFLRFPFCIQYKCRPTCVKLVISYSGLTDTSNGYHVVKIMAWLVSIRRPDCVAWKTLMNAHANFVKLLIRTMYPLIVNVPVSGSLTGNCFHVNDSAKLIRYSKFGKLSLKQRKIKYTKDLCISMTGFTLNLPSVIYKYLNYHN